MHRSWFLFLDSTRPLFVFSLNSKWLTAILRFLFIFHQQYYMRVRCFNFEAFWSILLLIKKIWKINININNILLSTTLALVLSLSSCQVWFCLKTDNDFSENMIKLISSRTALAISTWHFMRLSSTIPIASLSWAAMTTDFPVLDSNRLMLLWTLGMSRTIFFFGAMEMLQ